MNWKGCHVCNSVFCLHIRVIRWMHSSSSTPESLHTVIVVGYVEQKLLDTPAISKFAFILSNEITKWQGANFPQISNAICSLLHHVRLLSVARLPSPSTFVNDCVQMSTKRAVWGYTFDGNMHLLNVLVMLFKLTVYFVLAITSLQRLL